MSLKRNLLANYIGQVWVSVMGLAFIPLYVKYLGIEAYGLIGIFAILQSIISLLDLGMSQTINREMARFTAGTHNASSIRNLLRSVELIVLPIVVISTLVIWMASEWLANQWLRIENLSVNEVAQAFSIIGAVNALRFAEGVYRSAIIGLQLHVLYNIVNCALATLRGVGAIGVLIFYSPTIEAFFIWQGAVSLLSLFMLGKITYSALPKANSQGKFSISSLRDIRSFAGGMIGISILSLMLTQIDKIILSKLLTLSEFGYYTLATLIANALYLITTPISQAWSPRLTELYATKNNDELISKFHQGAQLVSVIMGSAAVMMIFFAEPILQLWTQDAYLSQRSSILLSILSLGTLLNGMMWIPYQTQLAHGWTSLAIGVNIVSVILIIPLVIWITPLYGAVGAAWVWVGLNAAYIFIGVHLMFRKILKGEKLRWYVQDLFRPLITAALFAGISALLMPISLSSYWQIIWMILTGVFTLVSAVSTTPKVASQLLINRLYFTSKN